jgi:hypothetical protein
MATTNPILIKSPKPTDHHSNTKTSSPYKEEDLQNLMNYNDIIDIEELIKSKDSAQYQDYIYDPNENEDYYDYSMDGSSSKLFNFDDYFTL